MTREDAPFERAEPALGEPYPPAAAGQPLQPAPAEWRRVLDEAIEADRQGKLGIALRLGVSRPYVSRVTTGHIPKASPRFVARVLALLQSVPCPFLGRELTTTECRGYAERAYERIGAPEVAHWRACQRCEHNPRRKLEAAGLGAAALPALEPEEPQPPPQRDDSHEPPAQPAHDQPEEDRA